MKKSIEQKKSGRLFKNYLVTSRHFLCFSVGGGSTPM